MVLKWDILTLQDCFWLCCKYILVSWHKLPLKKKRKEKKAYSWGSQAYEGATTSQTITALQRASLSLRGSWCWKLWLTRFFKALLHLPYFRAAVPFPNHKWLGHVHKDRYSHLRFNLWDRVWRGDADWCSAWTVLKVRTGEVICPQSAINV